MMILSMYLTMLFVVLGLDTPLGSPLNILYIFAAMIWYTVAYISYRQLLSIIRALEDKQKGDKYS